MTTVLGFAQDGVVDMAADSMTNVYDRPVVGVRKILRLPAGTGECLLGVAGDGALPGLLRAHLKIDGQPVGSEDVVGWASAVAVAITDLAVEHGYTDHDGRLNGHMLLGWSGRLWSICHGQAVYHPDGRAAIGSGEGPAMGALDAFLECGSLGGVAVLRAVEIAISRDKHSGHPIFTEVLL